jgi:hypothetical protein
VGRSSRARRCELASRPPSLRWVSGGVNGPTLASREAGEVRRDVTQADIVNLIWSNGRIIDATSTTAPNAWRRYLHLMLDAYRAERAHPIPVPPMTYEQLYDAMVHLSEAE